MIDLKPRVLFNRINIIHMATSTLQRLNELCIKLKIATTYSVQHC